MVRFHDNGRFSVVERAGWSAGGLVSGREGGSISLCSIKQWSVRSNGLGDKRIHVIGDDGKPVECYSGPIGSAAGKINRQHHLIIDKQGFVATVDHVENNVVLLSPSLTYVRKLIPADNGLPAKPLRMHFDERHRLLFVTGCTDELSVLRDETAKCQSKLSLMCVFNIIIIINSLFYSPYWIAHIDLRRKGAG